MKKIDLHIHTVASSTDSSFSFNLQNLIKYVTEARLDAIAITNHNLFDENQFRIIKESLDVIVFPGIEINVDSGHILIIGNVANLKDFNNKANRVSQRIAEVNSVSVNELEKIFGDLDDYLVIPHYDKEPAIRSDILDHITDYVSAGEVDSAKKFIRAIKDKNKLTPVLFSDVRISDELDSCPIRHTYIDCGDLTLNAIKACLKDKGKVALSETDGNALFQIFDDGQKLSTGLNVLLGERSTGKSYTLDRINNSYPNVKYIRQFSLVQLDDDMYEREFNSDVQRKRSQFTEEYLAQLKVVLNDVVDVDLYANERAVEKYVSSLLKSAEEEDKKDAYSKTALFDESEFPISEVDVLCRLIESVQQLIENLEYRPIIEKHIDINSMKRLACELIELLWAKKFEAKKKKFVNSLIRDIRTSLKMRTSAVQIEDIDLYRITLDKKKVDRFSEIVKCLQREAKISEESIQGFSIVTRKSPFDSAGELRAASPAKIAFSELYKEYEQPYDYLQALKNDDRLPRSELYKLFVKISYEILNKDGFKVSGGERSEFRLLQEIKDAQNFDFLLIDEPESSFDNLFLKSNVNQLISEISGSMPVVVVTHNNTVGASIGADYLLYAKKEIEEGDVVYKLYSGYPTDKNLTALDGKTISNYEIILNSLEAGSDTYKDRSKTYEAIKD